MKRENNPCQVWQRQDLAKLFLEDVRGGIPLAAEPLDVLLRTVRHATAAVDRLLDLGCGDGILGRTVLAEYPLATGVFVDCFFKLFQLAWFGGKKR